MTMMAFAGPVASLQSVWLPRRAVDLVAGNLVALDARSNNLIIRQGTSNVTSTARFRFVYDLSGF